MGFLSKIKRKKYTSNNAQLVKNNSNDTPPSMGPIDPDGSTASHSSNEIYVTNPQQSAAMTASQFQNTSDTEVNKKRLSQPKGSKYTQSNTSSLNIRSTQGKNCNTKSRDGVPIITSDGADYFSPSAVSTKKNYAVDGFYSKSKQMFGGKERPKTRPSARSSAFGGAPRYDWMDIETTAAIKIQAVYRRIQTLNYLDANGLSTPGMRNRRAQRKARYQTRMAKHATSADVPFPFNMCGVGLLFGDGTFEDEKIVDDIEKKKKSKKKYQMYQEDEEKRKFRMRKKESQHMEEGIEVVESFDGGEQEMEEEEDEEPEQMGRVRSKMSFGFGSKKK